jgi:two-component system, OmpR family, KDP operon response regulator KdpE
VRAGLRRNARGPEQTSSLKLGPVEVDLARRRAHGPRGNIHLTALQFRVLDCLARRGGMLVRHSELLREVWGPDRTEDARGLRVCIKCLRDKLETDRRRPRFLVTEIGLGYRLGTNETVQAVSAMQE